MGHRLEAAWTAFAAHDPAAAAAALAEHVDDASLGAHVLALALHELAMARFTLGDPALGQSLLARASRLEGEAGLGHAKGHTLHQASLLVHHRGDLERTAAYYRETLENLRRMRNDVGMALCGRSLGILALACGDRVGATLAWIDGQTRFARHHAGEASCLQSWLDELQAPAG